MVQVKLWKVCLASGRSGRNVSSREEIDCPKTERVEKERELHFTAFEFWRTKLEFFVKENLAQIFIAGKLFLQHT